MLKVLIQIWLKLFLKVNKYDSSSHQLLTEKIEHVYKIQLNIVALSSCQGVDKVTSIHQKM